ASSSGSSSRLRVNPLGAASSPHATTLVFSRRYGNKFLFRRGGIPMADDLSETMAASGGSGIPSAVPTVLPTGSMSEEARIYLREQTELARLQKQNLVEQNAFELSHLRWRRFNDQMKGALQIMVVALGMLIVIAVAAAVWNASRAEGIVVESFAV